MRKTVEPRGVEEKIDDLRIRVVALEVKMNIVAYISGAALSGIIILVLTHVI